MDEILNNNEGFHDFITVNPEHQKMLNKKIEKEIMEKRKMAEKNTAGQETCEIRSIKDVPADLLFTKHTIWIATNLKTLIEFELSGMNVNLYLGENQPLRQLLCEGHVDSFHKDGLYIKFQKCI